MIKTMGAVLVIGAFSASGLHTALALKKRAEVLASMIWALEIAKSEIYFNLTPLPELIAYLARQAEGEARKFFGDIEKRMAAGDESGFYEIWKDCGSAFVSLNEGDLHILQDAARLMGRYGAEEQSEGLACALRRLELRLAEAEKEKAVKGKLYRALGTGLGILAVLLLI